MSIFNLIESDHRTIRGILRKLVESTKRARKSREDQVEALKDIILPHMHAEESLLYPFIQDDSDEPELALVAIEEHQVVRNMLADVEVTSINDHRWSAKVKVLQEIAGHHMQQEESAVFNKALRLIDEDRAEEMGKRFEALKREAMAASA